MCFIDRLSRALPPPQAAHTVYKNQLQPKTNTKCASYSSSGPFCFSFKRAVYPHLLLLPRVGTQLLRFLFRSRGLDPQGPHPKIRETSPIAAGETESKFGSFVRSACDSDVTTDNAHRTIGCFRREVDTLGFQSYPRVLAPLWIYHPGPVDERYPNIVEPKVTVYGFAD